MKLYRLAETCIQRTYLLVELHSVARFVAYILNRTGLCISPEDVCV